MKKSARGPLIWIIGFVLIILLISWLTSDNGTDDREIDYDAFMQEVEAGNILRYETFGDDLHGNDLYAVKVGTEVNLDKFPGEYDYYLYVPDFGKFSSDMVAKGGDDIPHKNNPTPEQSFLASSWPFLLSIGLIAVVFIYIMGNSRAAETKRFLSESQGPVCRLAARTKRRLRT